MRSCLRVNYSNATPEMLVEETESATNRIYCRGTDLRFTLTFRPLLPNRGIIGPEVLLYQLRED